MRCRLFFWGSLKIGYSETVLVELVINEQLAADGRRLRVRTEVA